MSLRYDLLKYNYETFHPRYEWVQPFLSLLIFVAIDHKFKSIFKSFFMSRDSKTCSELLIIFWRFNCFKLMINFIKIQSNNWIKNEWLLSSNFSNNVKEDSKKWIGSPNH